MSMDAPTMDVLRKQAIAMAMLWLTARDYDHEGGRAWFHVRARDLGLRDDVLPGKRIRVTIEAELDTDGVTVLPGQQEVTEAMKLAGVREMLDASPDEAWEERIARVYIAMRNAGVMVDAVAQERERCAAIADDEARIREEAGRKHPEESAPRDRCFAAARAAANVAKGIRSGEVVAGVPVCTFPACRAGNCCANPSNARGVTGRFQQPISPHTPPIPEEPKAQPR